MALIDLYQHFILSEQFYSYTFCPLESLFLVLVEEMLRTF